MSTQIEHLERRVELLDRELAAVRTELWALKRAEPVVPPPTPGPAPAPPPAPPRTVFVPAPPAPPRPKDDLFAGRLMAWVGGSAVLIGLILFLALAVSRGWIGEAERTAMAALASMLLVAGGARAFERRGRTEAAVAATAAGAAGGFATLAVATEVYALVPAAVGLPLGLAWGAVAAALALRWRSQTMAVLGIAGGLLSPVLAGADPEAAATIALLGIGYAGAVAVCVALGWAWLGLLAFALVTPQWAYHLLDQPSLAPVIAFGLLGAVAATGFELRVRERAFGVASHLLLGLNATAMACAGWAVLWESGVEPVAGRAWLAALAAAHLAGGIAALRSARVSRSMAVAALAIGVVLADIVFAEFASGLVLPLAWAAGAAFFALLTRFEKTAALGLGGHLALAIGHLLAQEAPFADLGGGGSAAGVAGAAAVAASCLVSARLVGTRWAELLDGMGLLALAYTTTLAFEGAPLVAALSAEAAALGALRHRRAAEAFLLYAAAGALAVVAPLRALADGVGDAGAAILALGAIAAAAPAVTRRGRLAGAPVLVYLASVLVVTWVEGQPGQLSLSALWGATGLAALLVGVLRDRAPLRAAGLWLLAVASAKVFIVDLSSLDSMTRVGSFLVIGTLLLAGAYAWQRARPGQDAP